MERVVLSCLGKNYVKKMIFAVSTASRQEKHKGPPIQVGLYPSGTPYTVRNSERSKFALNMSSFLQEYLPEERSRYPEHIFHNPFDQPDLLVEMVLCLHIQNSKMVKKIDRTMKIALITYHSSKKKDPDLRVRFL